MGEDQMSLWAVPLLLTQFNYYSTDAIGVRELFIHPCPTLVSNLLS